MLRKPLIFSIIVLSACSQFQTVSGNGRFLQSSLNGLLYAQFDTSSPEACKREGKVEKKEGVELVCATVSLEAMLPSSFTVTNPMTGEKTKARARTLKACELLQKEFKKNEALKAYEVSQSE